MRASLKWKRKMMKKEKKERGKVYQFALSKHQHGGLGSEKENRRKNYRKVITIREVLEMTNEGKWNKEKG